jgi:hypothetical protein
MDLDDLLDGVVSKSKHNNQEDDDGWGVPAAVPKSKTPAVAPVKST